MDEAKKINGMFMGKLFNKKGQTKAGKEFKSYKYQFECEMENNVKKVWNFWGFGDTKGCESLEDGKMYCVGYKENPIKLPDGTDGKSKNVLWVGDPSTSPTPLTAQTNTNISNQGNVPNVGSTAQNDSKVDFPIEEVYAKYISMREPGSRSVSELLGLYLKTNKPDHPIVQMVSKYYTDITTDKSESL